MLLPNLKYYRMLAGYTQRDLAEAAGVNRVTVANLELGRSHVGPHTLKKLADALGVSTRELVEPLQSDSA
jgi:mRNA interferase RelE/StbE